MTFQEFQDSTKVEFKNESRRVEINKFLNFCKQNGIFVECITVLNDDNIAKMIVVLIDGVFYTTYATKGLSGDLMLHYDEFSKVTKEVAEREIRETKEFYEKILGTKKFLDEDYKNKIVIQNTFSNIQPIK